MYWQNPGCTLLCGESVALCALSRGEDTAELPKGCEAVFACSLLQSGQSVYRLHRVVRCPQTLRPSCALYITCTMLLFIRHSRPLRVVLLRDVGQAAEGAAVAVT